MRRSFYYTTDLRSFRMLWSILRLTSTSTDLGTFKLINPTNIETVVSRFPSLAVVAKAWILPSSNIATNTHKISQEWKRFQDLTSYKPASHSRHTSTRLEGVPLWLTSSHLSKWWTLTFPTSEETSRRSSRAPHIANFLNEKSRSSAWYMSHYWLALNSLVCKMEEEHSFCLEMFRKKKTWKRA